MHTAILEYLDASGKLYQRLLAPIREAAGLTQTELDILLFLANNPDRDTASDIVSLRHLAKSNVSVGVRGLEAKGLLLRRPDGRDRRLEHLSPAPAAAQAVELGRRAQEAFLQVLTQGFSPQERETLEGLTARIRHNVAQALRTLG